MIQAFKVFRKLHYQFKAFNKKMEEEMGKGGEGQVRSQMGYL